LGNLDGDPQILIKRRVGSSGLKIKIPGAALRVEAEGDGNGFQQGRLAGTVFSDENNDGTIKLQSAELLKITDRRERVQIRVLGRRFFQADALYIAADGQHRLVIPARSGWIRRRFHRP
jgi:hypothetical protein